MKRLMLLACLLCPMIVAAKVYKWTDEDGNVHYTEQPPPQGVNSETVDTSQAERSESQARDAARRQQQIETRREANETDPYEADQQQASEEEARIDAQKREACNTAQANLRVMQGGGRVYELDADGRRVYIEDAERQNRIAGYQREIDQYCE